MSKKMTSEEQYNDIIARICHILTIYPGISPTMLQVGIGPSISSAIWKPILQEMEDRGEVIRAYHNAQAPSRRYNNYVKLSLIAA